MSIKMVKEKKIKELKGYLKKISDKDINKLSSDFDASKLTKTQIKLCLDVATFLYGKETFTQKQLEPFMNQAGVWFVLEKLRRERLITVDDKGVPNRTKFGQQVFEHMEEAKKP